MSIIKTVTNFFFRLDAAYTILFGNKNNHWFIIQMDRDNLKELIKKDTFKKAQMIRYGMQEYNVKQMCRAMIDDMKFDDWVTGKAMFEAQADYDTD